MWTLSQGVFWRIQFKNSLQNAQRGETLQMRTVPSHVYAVVKFKGSCKASYAEEFGKPVFITHTHKPLLNTSVCFYNYMQCLAHVSLRVQVLCFQLFDSCSLGACQGTALTFLFVTEFSTCLNVKCCGSDFCLKFVSKQLTQRSEAKK